MTEGWLGVGVQGDGACVRRAIFLDIICCEVASFLSEFRII